MSIYGEIGVGIVILYVCSIGCSSQLIREGKPSTLILIAHCRRRHLTSDGLLMMEMMEMRKESLRLCVAKVICKLA